MGSFENHKLVNLKVPKEHFSLLLDFSLESPSKKLFNYTSSIILEGSRSSSSSLHEIGNQSSPEQMDEENNNEIYHPDPNSSLCFNKSLLLDTSGEVPEEDLVDIPLVSLSGDEVSDIKGLPKGWVMENVPEIATKNILCNIDESNIISRKREQKQPVYIATVHSLPMNDHAAVNHPMASEWIRAINEEVKSIAKHSVWKVVKIPQNANLLGSTWVFREKENSAGVAIQYKARLCVQGFAQIEGIDFNEAFAPTRRLNSLRFILSYCAHKNLEIHQMDVKTAFLY
ncbi:hypothetical protein O181_123305 [Austropuccinia psidii MF-1]|uniref:Reverse transcriptase Ty1/copia-type domain-containing protein n=1 Tax=Austropuccinia psidii MF-1 TaxID=1389203 RepID=A0A9Q3KKW6_9BASI|nr:hypothetical protein [Austropuccinia psidii MF-1]